MAVLPIGMSGEAGGYQIERSLRFNSADSAYLSRTPASAGNRKTWTWSGWVKRSALGTTQLCFATYFANNDTSQFQIGFNTSDKLQVAFFSLVPLVSTQVFRDVSAWYHLVVAFDSTQGTASNRLKAYINGLEVTSWATDNRSSISNQDYGINAAQAHFIGYGNYAGSYLNGYLTDINFIDGSALTPSSFGENDTDTGVWKPKAYTGSYGTNGFSLKFADNSGTTSTTLGKDSSGNGNNWTPNNFSVTAGAGNDSLVDTPTPYGTDTGAGGEVRGNYATLNPLVTAGASAITISNGNLDLSIGTSGSWRTSAGTFPMSSGKWYWEVRINTASDLGDVIIGIAAADAIPTTSYAGSNASSYGYMGAGFKYNNGSAVAYGATMAATDIIGVSLDMSTGALVFYRNGSSQGTAYTVDTTKTYVAAVSGASTTPTYSVNFGQRPFAYTAPSGFKALCTQNLPEPTVVQGDDYFNTVLWTGNDASPRTITGVGFQPDLVWIKPRSLAQAHHIFDAVRGTQVELRSNTTDAELTSTYGNLTAYASDGFTLTAGVNGIANVNANNETFVAWNWKGNGSGVSNTAGSITSTVSANTTSGFSIVTYTGNLTAGATVGHGLGAAPQMVIVKERGATRSWIVYHVGYGATKFLTLNTTDGEQTYSGMWNNTAPSSTVFTIGSDGAVNTSSGTYVAYCFAPVAGFSAFGSYVGNNSTDGPFVYTGFRPAFIMIKTTANFTAGWVIVDSKRNVYNVVNAQLYPDQSAAESTSNFGIDFCSNGFKMRNADNYANGSGYTYVYAAFAEVPAKFSLAR